MEDVIISYETAKLAKEKGFNIDSFYFYTKPNSKVFGIDEHGRNYPIVNKPKTLFVVGNAVALNVKNVYLAPTQSLLQKWLRDIHNIHIQIDRVFNCYQFDVLKYDKYEDRNEVMFNGIGVRDFTTYEEALEQALQEALKLIEI